MRYALALAVAALAWLPGCSQPAAPGSPQGWTERNATTWTQGSGAARETYTFVKKPFDGSLSALASQEAIDAILRYPGARFVGSLPLPDCPAQAGIATFARPHTTLEAAFSVRNGQALIIFYERPARLPPSKAARAAMSATLCSTPL